MFLRLLWLIFSVSGVVHIAVCINKIYMYIVFKRRIKISFLLSTNQKVLVRILTSGSSAELFTVGGGEVGLDRRCLQPASDTSFLSLAATL